MAFGSTYSCFLGLIVLVISSVPLGVHTATIREWTKNFAQHVTSLSPSTTQNVLLNENEMYKVFSSLSGIVQDMYSESVVDLPHLVVGLGPSPGGVDQFQTDKIVQNINPNTDGMIFYKDVQKMDVEMWPSTTGEGAAHSLFNAVKSLQRIFSRKRPRAVQGEKPNYLTGAEMLVFQGDLMQLSTHIQAINQFTQTPFESDNSKLSITVTFQPHRKGISHVSPGPFDAVKIIFSYSPLFPSSTTTTTTSTTPISTSTSSSTTLVSTSTTSPYTTTSDASRLTVYGVCAASSVLFASVML